MENSCAKSLIIKAGSKIQVDDELYELLEDLVVDCACAAYYKSEKHGIIADPDEG